MPQSVSQMGVSRQGKSIEAARRLIDGARALEDAGAFSLVLEGIPARLAGLITRSLSIPTIGIGAGLECDGQVLVTHDLLGLFDRFTPKFAKRYTNLADAMRAAFESFRAEVQARTFPAPEHTFTLPDDVWDALTAGNSYDGG